MMQVYGYIVRLKYCVRFDLAEITVLEVLAHHLLQIFNQQSLLMIPLLLINYLDIDLLIRSRLVVISVDTVHQNWGFVFLFELFFDGMKKDVKRSGRLAFVGRNISYMFYTTFAQAHKSVVRRWKLNKFPSSFVKINDQIIAAAFFDFVIVTD
ncbi:unnamed protein product [Enterobius vermicularis]|uniref:Uncharacterized protein n=1 Tax=Enterobius vermicularis TaxID=51028 RepID=A0A0N4UST2_ENTVE|nr:unnamed protein product [Enterobius vermicularis]